LSSLNIHVSKQRANLSQDRVEMLIQFTYIYTFIVEFLNSSNTKRNNIREYNDLNCFPCFHLSQNRTSEWLFSKRHWTLGMCGFCNVRVFWQLFGRFGNMSTCIYCVLYCLYCVFALSLLCIFIPVCCLCVEYCHRVKTQLQ
jgi:hypothetical protein